MLKSKVVYHTDYWKLEEQINEALAAIHAEGGIFNGIAQSSTSSVGGMKERHVATIVYDISQND